MPADDQSKPAQSPVRLGTLEQRVMDSLWDNGPSSVREIIEHLGGTAAYTTIATVFTNLERKEMVASTRDGRLVRYSASHTREEHAAQLMEQALSTSHDRAASILHFVNAIDSREAQMLRDYLDNKSDR